MTTSAILHVGNDICRRIPVMRTASFAVFQSEASIFALRKAFGNGDIFSALTFASDDSAPSESVVSTARSLTAAPLILFENASIYCDESAFDIIVPALTHPTRWLKKLHDRIEETREHPESARQIRQECAIVRSYFQTLRAKSASITKNPIDLDPLWRPDKDDYPQRIDIES